MTDVRPDADSELPRWSTADVFESFTSRPFVDAMERLASDVERLVARFDEAGVRAADLALPNLLLIDLALDYHLAPRLAAA